MTRFIFVFIDGIGLGEAIKSNPFYTLTLPGFNLLSSGHPWLLDSPRIRESRTTFVPIDATLDVEGLPQSGTGQASLFTGRNCARIVGRHFGPYPHTSTFAAIASENIFSRVEGSAFANAYPDRFLRRAKTRNRWSVTTRSCREAGIRLRRLEDLARGRALAADITGNGLSGVSQQRVDTITEETAAERLHHLGAEHCLTVFEYFHTDKAGHARSALDARRVLHSLSRFLSRLVELCDLSGITLLVTSDHGNLEDLSVKTHTRNPVPLAVRGPAADAFGSAISLTDVTPLIDSVLEGAHRK